MKRMAKKRILAAGIFILLFVAGGYASTTWSLSPDGVLTIGGIGQMDDYNYNSSPWYSQRETIKSVIISDGVTTIGKYAFYDCSSLTSVTIPNSVTTIGNDAFIYCSSLTSVTIPNSVTTIGNTAFYYCSRLTSVSIPNSVTTIGDAAFYGCSSLTSVTIPNSVTTIGDAAFYGCRRLTSVSIPASVEEIGDRAFASCGELIEFIVASENPAYSSMDGVLFDKEKTLLICFPPKKPETTYVIPNSVTKIGDSAFYYCSSLTSVSIPNSVTTIGNDAFYYCSSLTSVTIPNSVTTIGNYAFYYCSSLTSVTIPNSVTEIGYYAFYGCRRLTSVSIPASVEEIGYRAFTYCGELIEFIVASENPAYSSMDGVLFDKEKTLLICFPPKKPETTYVIPNSVTKIGDYAFYYCSSLTSVSIPNSVTEIGYCAFNSCGKLTSVTFPDSLKTIGYASFEMCGFSSITIPASVTAIDSWAFTKCPNLESVVFMGPIKTTGYNIFATYFNNELNYSLKVEVKCEPFVVNSGCFDVVNLSNSTLIVPDGTKALYEAAPVWQNFGSIIEKSNTGILSIPKEDVNVYLSGNILHIYSPVPETLALYSLTGKQLFSTKKTAGMFLFPLNAPAGQVLIVKGSSGWTKKIVN